MFFQFSHVFSSIPKNWKNYNMMFLTSFTAYTNSLTVITRAILMSLIVPRPTRSLHRSYYGDACPLATSFKASPEPACTAAIKLDLTTLFCVCTWCWDWWFSLQWKKRKKKKRKTLRRSTTNSYLFRVDSRGIGAHHTTTSFEVIKHIG